MTVQIQKLIDELRKRPYVLFGAATLAKRFMQSSFANDHAPKAIIDLDPKKIGQDFFGYQIMGLGGIAKDDLVIVCTHRIGRATAVLAKNGYDAVIPYAALASVDPSCFSEHEFYTGLKQMPDHHENELTWVRSFFDEQSQRIFDGVMAYRQSFDLQHLHGLVSGDDYFPTDVYSYSDCEVLIDGGAFDGDSARNFLSRVGHKYKKIVCFEPDVDNFTKLSASLSDEPNTYCFQKGLYEQTGILSFESSHDQAAAFVAGGSDKVEVIAIDAVPECADATLIKLNIEGAEPEALLGARELLTERRPKLAIAVYHRPDHIWRIPLLIKEIVPEYEFSLRQHDDAVVETVLYASVPS